MPVSKSGQQYYTKQQYAIAKDVGALEYAQARGYDLRRDGRNYRMAEHDSMIFTADGYWFWNSKRIRGKAIAFAIHYEHLTLVEAVLAVAGYGASATSLPPQTAADQPQQVAFVSPRRAEHAKRLYAYLCQTRGLSRQTITDLVRRNLLYEGIIERNGKEYHNAIFPYRDADGRIVGAYQRGLRSDVPYKCDVPGSRKCCGWVIPGNGGSKILYVFEAMIDAASQLDFARLTGRGDDAADRLALSGLDKKPLIQYIRMHPALERIVIMLDNDAAGNDGAVWLKAAALAERPTLTITRELPPFGKDWNDALRKRKNLP